MHVGVVAQNPGCLHGIILMFLGQLLQGVVSFLIDQIALLNPALNPASGANAGEAAVAVDYLDALAILHIAYAVIDGGNLVAQRGLRR